jgi:ribonucleoside-diphosphate reductase beta chain
MSVEISPEEATLQELQSTPIDRVLDIIDHGLVHLPSYRELYYRWENQHWEAGEIDFIPDIIQWEDTAPEERALRIQALATFFQGEASVTDGLAPYVIAMPDEEMRIYVTTQLVDESRHTIFFTRFFNEVLGMDEGSLEATLAKAKAYMNPYSKAIIIEALDDVADRIRRDPRNMEILVEGVTIYHVLIEGTMALAGQRTLLERYRKDNIFPGFRAGFTAVARDESRHVLFGVKFLRDMIHKDPKYAQIVYKTISRHIANAFQSVALPEDRIEALLAEKEDPWETPRYARRSLEKKLRVIGLNIELPELPAVPKFS